jgi:hypothetical protein
LSLTASAGVVLLLVLFFPVAAVAMWNLPCSSRSA